MKRLRWQILIVILSLAAIGILLLSQSPPAQPPIVPAATPRPISGGSYSEGIIGSPGRLNPVLSYYNAADRDVNRLIYSSLMRFDDRGLPRPDLAESWGISRDGTVYNLSLRSGATWHDGEPVDGADVLFTIQLLRDPELPLPPDIQNLWRDVEVEALDDHLIQFRLPEPFAPFPDYLTFGILPEHLLADVPAPDLIDHPFNLHPIGSGPYQFVEFISESSQIIGVQLAANDDYYDGRPFIDEVKFLFLPDGPTAVQAYLDGAIMGISSISADVLMTALDSPAINLYTARLPQLSLVLLNLDNPDVPFFQELEVRKALMMALNRQRMINQFLQGQAIAAQSPILPGSWAYFEVDNALQYEPEFAESTLRSAGYTIPAAGGRIRAKEDVFLSFTLLYPEGTTYQRIAQAIQGGWQQLGVEVLLEPVPYDQLIQAHLETRNYQAALVDHNLMGQYDPDPYPFWHQSQITGGQNYSQWNDRIASEFLEQARIISDLDERLRLYRNFQVRFARELPALPLFYPVYTYGISPEILGVSMGPLFDTSDRLAGLVSWHLQTEGGPAAPDLDTPINPTP